jgi:hypothetical protein
MFMKEWELKWGKWKIKSRNWIVLKLNIIDLGKLEC